MLLHDPRLSRTAFEAGTGWQLEPEGACRGEVCIPLSEPVADEVDPISLAEQMGLPVVIDAEHGVSAIGPWPGTGRALVSAEAPELVLPDLDGNDFRLSSLLGQKVLILCWAPY